MATDDKAATLVTAGAAMFLLGFVLAIVVGWVGGWFVMAGGALTMLLVSTARR